MIGVVARGVFWICACWIVFVSTLTSWQSGDVVMAAAKVVFFPLTYVFAPWGLDLGWLFMVSLVAYVISTTVGRLPPVD